MKFTRILSFLLCLSLIFGLLAGLTVSAAGKIVTTPTSYTKASDVEYKIVDNRYIANWGARGEDCVFLSSYATEYYTGSYTYEILSQNSGGSTQSNAHNSDLYKALQSMMQTKHTYKTSYDGTRYLYRYTDCLRNDIDHISSFYSGVTLNGEWDQGKTWNREHTWPKSKGESSSEKADIMMLRPTSVSENSSRANIAYGESSNYYDPGVAVRGDCARIVLYVYTRWGNTTYMWGESGVMESLSVLLKWMEEDPVDTWEMGRNDAVQSITGVRNVYVDYPEFAWLLFSKSIPADMTTPSGNNVEVPCAHEHTEIRDYVEPTCTEIGFNGNTYCLDCGETIANGIEIDALGHDYQNGICSRCGEEEPCDHASTEIRNAVAPDCLESGYTGDTYCADCGDILSAGSVIPALGHDYQDGACSRCGEAAPCEHKNKEVRDKVEVTCTTDGYSGDTYCLDCGAKLYRGGKIKATGHDYKDGICANCGEKDPNAAEPPVVDPDPDPDPEAECYFADFKDCKDAWYHEAVDYTVANGLMKGVADGKFDPSGAMTRGMIVTVLYRAAGSPEVGASSFTDVKAGEWYADAIAWAQAEGIVKGISETEFAPNAYVTREQIATILWRYSGSEKVNADLSSFKDTGKISAYAQDAIAWAVAGGILNGADNKLNPTNNATRAEFACIIMRYLGGSYACK